MDPSAMDFVMNRPQPGANRGGLMPLAMDHQHSPCPALRAVAEHNQLPGLHSPPRGASGSHYDPVHGSMNTGNWWHHGLYDNWQHPPYNPPHIPPRQMSIYPQHPPSFGAPPGIIPPTIIPQANALPVPPFGIGSALGDYYGMHGHTHAHAHAHGHSTSRFPHRPTIPGIDRLGSAGPSQQNLSAYGNASNSEHAARSSRLPGLSQISNNPSNPPASRDLSSPIRQDHNAGSTGTPESHMSTRSSTATVTMPPIPQRASGSVTNSPRSFVGRAGHRYRAGIPSLDSPSDDDSDQNETELMTARMLDVLAAGGGPEGNVRAAQLLRGAVPGRNRASKKAIASLESIKIDDLPETERTCIICYNDFGTETPEGINEAPLRLPKCQHVFGDHCIKKWFAESDSCPYCRDKLPSEPQRHLSPEAAFHIMRQHQVFRHATRDTWTRENHEESGWEGASVSSNRRLDALPSFRSWQTSDRRSPPGDLGESRRRTRPRHTSLRGSPPSGRSNQFGTSIVPGMNFNQHHNSGRGHVPNHAYRHSMGAVGTPPTSATFDQSIPPFLGHPSIFQPHESRLPLPNPLASNGVEMDYSWTSGRPEHYPPISTTLSGPEVRMAPSDLAVGIERNAGSPA